MFKRTLVAATVAAFALPALAADAPQVKEKEQAKEQTKEQARERIYGSQMMTPEERRVYHNQMRAAKTQEEREQIRHAHHDEMVNRAKARGITLPDEPPMRGGGGMGPGSGGGMGPGGGGMSPGGGGMGPGGGMGTGGKGMGY